MAVTQEQERRSVQREVDKWKEQNNQRKMKKKCLKLLF